MGQAADGDDVQRATALLNLVSLGVTARYVVSQLQDAAGPATWRTAWTCRRWRRSLWLVVALVPMSALFSALCLACAAFARSTKEGQYYLMPLLLVTMPLMMLPMAPGAELNLGNSLIPVTGVVLLLMSLVQGNYAEVLRYVVPVCVRDADLLPSGDPLGRVSVQPGVGAVPRERAARSAALAGAPGARSAGHAVAGRGVFLRRADFRDSVFHAAWRSRPIRRRRRISAILALLLFISQVVCIALPALLMTVLLTGRPLKTLLLDRRRARRRAAWPCCWRCCCTRWDCSSCIGFASCIRSKAKCSTRLEAFARVVARRRRSRGCRTC